MGSAAPTIAFPSDVPSLAPTGIADEALGILEENNNSLTAQDKDDIIFATISLLKKHQLRQSIPLFVAVLRDFKLILFIVLLYMFCCCRLPMNVPRKSFDSILF